MLADALLNSTRPTVISLTEAIIAREAATDSADVPFAAETAAAMIAKIAQMPPHLRLGLRVLTASFGSYARMRTGRTLAALPVSRRQALLAEWRAAPIGPCRQLVQFYEKMGAFLYYSHLEESLMPPIEVR